MPDYRAPLRDIRFVVHDVLDFEDHYRSYGREELNRGLLEGILGEELSHVQALDGMLAKLHWMSPAPTEVNNCETSR